MVVHAYHASPVGFHDEEVKVPAVIAARERDPTAVRRPRWLPPARCVGGEARYVRAVRVHDVDAPGIVAGIGIAAPVAPERDPVAVRRPGGVAVVSRAGAE